MDPFGATAHGYTLPQHHRCGYTWVLSTTVAIFGHVALDNFPIQESQGFQHQPSLCHHYPHPRASDSSCLSPLTQHQPPPPT
ncbi:hypothetical protein KIL84_006921 [Mauremys mutica]|uniref:Uncharacterized protein n=1 Tax=Mauremys mutica TaxID=74926 RepID=A0A9D3X2A1_9SAUR|nr:hypothetical protein KIL84_006921 [Mauremys mutica]